MTDFRINNYSAGQQTLGYSRVHDLPGCMMERAVRARSIAAENPERVQCDDDYLPWVYDPDTETWLSFFGNYSSMSPLEKAERERERIRQRDQRHDETVEQYAKDVAYQSMIRQKILERDSYTCQICFSEAETKLHVHHILKRRDGGTDHFDNLITVCPTCHKSADSKKYYDPPWATRKFEAA